VKKIILESFKLIKFVDPRVRYYF